MNFGAFCQRFEKYSLSAYLAHLTDDKCWQESDLCLENSFAEMSVSNVKELVFNEAKKDKPFISLKLTRAMLFIRLIYKIADDHEKRSHERMKNEHKTFM